MTPEPRIAVYEMTTPGSSFEQDLHDYVEAGIQGIGICEFKLPSGSGVAALRALKASGLGVASCLPTVDSFLPQPLVPGPEDPAERLTALCASVRRLALFGPSCIICTTGPIGSVEPARAAEIVASGLYRLGQLAQTEGVRVALEPLHASLANDWTFVSTFSKALELVAMANSPAVGVLFDFWHLAEIPRIEEQVRDHASRVFGVHVSDRRNPTRGWCDRALPGSGTLDMSGLLGVLDSAGYSGWYDLEIFSDNGRFGTAYADSLWDLPPIELVRRARQGLLRSWEART